MSIIPYNNYRVRDLTGNKEPYVSSTIEFGYFSGVSLGSVSNLHSIPTYLNTNNGIATVDASGLHILHAGIYTLNLSIDCSATSMATTNDGIIYFNFGTNYLNGVSLANITGSFGGTHTSGMFSFGSNSTTYPGIIDWSVNSFNSGSNPTSSKYYSTSSSAVTTTNNQLMWGYACNNYTNGGRLVPGICTTKITFIINQPTIIYLNTCCMGTSGNPVPVYGLTMGKSYFTLQLISNISPFILNWTQTNSTPTSYGAITSSSDGTKLFAGSTGGIYMSSNSGSSWSLLSNSNKGNWRSIASNSNSTNIVAGLNAGGIYYSSDPSHNTWTQASGAPSTGGTSWRAIASSSDGTKLAAVNYGGQIYTSDNSGNSWIARDSNRSWTSIASDNTCTKLAATVSNGYIYTSINSGVNWTPQTASGSTNWQCIASSSDGTKLAAGASDPTNGGIYYSTDSGAHWNKSDAPNNNWQAISSSSDGTKLVAVVNGGYIWSSLNSGVNWTQTNALSETWQAIASSSDGIKLAAVNTSSTPVYTGLYIY